MSSTMERLVEQMGLLRSLKEHGGSLESTFLIASLVVAAVTVAQ